MRHLIILPVLFLICSCSSAPPQTKNLIQDQHVIAKVLVQRVGTDKEPTKEQLLEYLKSSAQSWEAMDRQFNGYKSPEERCPKVDNGVIDLDKTGRKRTEEF